jgi:glycosyltransferase involved in cell wall biosynthesis
VAVPTIPFQNAADVDPHLLERYDLVVYNIGNHLPYHEAIFEIALRVPGLCILHDLVMQHFFVSYFLEKHRRQDLYVAAMEKHYGDEGRRVATMVVAGQASTFLNSDAPLRYPLFEEAVAGAYGLLVHSQWAEQRAARALPCPVGRLFLPYEIGETSEAMTRVELGVPEDKLLIVTVGHINSNRRIPAVLRVLIEEEALRSQVKYVIIGAREPRCDGELQELIRRHGLEGTVQLKGRVPDVMLAAYLRHADLCINLRWPTFESGSASLAEQMLYGKPVIVTDAGCYSEVPDDCVWKISPKRELEELAIALGKLVNDGQARQALGFRARDFAEKHFRPSQYAAGLLRFAWEVRNLRPVLEMADRLGALLHSMGIATQTPIVSELSRTCAELFGEPEVSRA